MNTIFLLSYLLLFILTILTSGIILIILAFALCLAENINNKINQYKKE